MVQVAYSDAFVGMLRFLHYPIGDNNGNKLEWHFRNTTQWSSYEGIELKFIFIDFNWTTFCDPNRKTIYSMRTSRAPIWSVKNSIERASGAHSTFTRCLRVFGRLCWMWLARQCWFIYSFDARFSSIKVTCGWVTRSRSNCCHFSPLAFYVRMHCRFGLWWHRLRTMGTTR